MCLEFLLLGIPSCQVHENSMLLILIDCYVILKSASIAASSFKPFETISRTKTKSKWHFAVIRFELSIPPTLLFQMHNSSSHSFKSTRICLFTVLLGFKYSPLANQVASQLAISSFNTSIP